LAHVGGTFVVVVVVVTIEHRAISNLTSHRCDYQPQFRAASTTAAHAPSHHHHRDDKLAHSDVNAVPTHDRRAAHSAYRFCVVVVVFHTGNVKFFFFLVKHVVAVDIVIRMTARRPNLVVRRTTLQQSSAKHLAQQPLFW
jgi:hypothetical protein